MTGLLDAFATGPRENGTPELAAATEAAASRLADAGWTVEPFTFTAAPHELQILGLVCALLGVVYGILLRRNRALSCIAVTLLPAVLAVAIVDGGLTPFGGVGSAEQACVIGRLPVENPDRRLVLAAHLDTKTELLDHIARTPVQIAGAAAVLLMIAVPLRTRYLQRRRARRSRLEATAARTAVAVGLGLMLVYSAGLVLPERSPGALDDGAACAVLLRAADDLAGAPPRRTEVVVALFTGEELGAHGSRAWVRSRDERWRAMPTVAVNFELVGSSRQLMVGKNVSLTRGGGVPASLLDRLDSASVAASGEPLLRTPLAGMTDAVAFTERGIPAATVLGREGRFLVPAGMHGPRDNLSRVNPESLEYLRRMVAELVHGFDGEERP
ncbi:MAG: M20/M25/M40 family metallo-hydrolase [Gemmatimonadetes bacterium]|nr:M20/M25/M40 family metallo-hydrolase [Gemmatimonadota bacterium]